MYCYENAFCIQIGRTERREREPIMGMQYKKIITRTELDEFTAFIKDDIIIAIIRTPDTYSNNQYGESTDFSRFEEIYTGFDQDSLVSAITARTETSAADRKIESFFSSLPIYMSREKVQLVKTTNKRGENKTMGNVNEMVKTGVNGETLIKGKNDGFYKILENGTLARELYVFENIAPIQKVNVQALKRHDIIEHEGGIWYVSAVTETALTITSFATLTSVNMAVLQADGLDTGFTKLVNPITFQIETLGVKARDLLATVPANVPKLQVAVEFANSDNIEKLTSAMLAFIATMK